MGEIVRVYHTTAQYHTNCCNKAEKIFKKRTQRNKLT